VIESGRFSGSLLVNYNTGTSNTTGSVIINATTPTNTNYSVSYRQKYTGSWNVIGPGYTGNQTLAIPGTKYQDTEVNITLYGNGTVFPDIETVRFVLEAEGGGGGSPQSQNGTYSIGTGLNASWDEFAKNHTTEDLGSHGIVVGNWSDNFNDNNEDWTGWANLTNEESVAGGAMLIQDANTDEFERKGVYYSGVNLTNSSIISKARISASDNLFLWFRAIQMGETTTDGYIWQLDINDPTLPISHFREVLNGADTLITETGLSSDVDTNYHTYITEVNGSNFRQIVDGTQVHSASDATYVSGKIGFTVRQNANDIMIDSLRITEVNRTSGSLIAWYNASTGNETWKIEIAATTPDNTNYIAEYAENGTGNWTQLGGTLTGNQEFVLPNNAKFTNTDVRLTLYGNQTETPEITSMNLLWQTAVDSPTEYTPPSPVNGSCSVSQYGARSVYCTWQAGT